MLAPIHRQYPEPARAYPEQENVNKRKNIFKLNIP
jgi:hypothetical protein